VDRTQVSGEIDQRLDNDLVASIIKRAVDQLADPLHAGQVRHRAFDWFYVLHRDGLELFRYGLDTQAGPRAVTRITRLSLGPLLGLELEERTLTQGIKGITEVVESLDSLVVRHAALNSEFEIRSSNGDQLTAVADLLRGWARKS
jgi:hypothetical protein